MPTHKKHVEYFVEGERITDTTDTVTNDGEVSYSGTIVKNTSDNQIDLAFPYLKVKSVCIYSSTAMTVETNSTSTPDDTFTLAAGEQLTWTVNESATCPFTVDVTKFYASNGSANDDATLKINVLLDVTP